MTDVSHTPAPGRRDPIEEPEERPQVIPEDEEIGEGQPRPTDTDGEPEA